MITQQTFGITTATAEMLARVYRREDISLDDALGLLVGYGYVVYRLSAIRQLGMDPLEGLPRDIPESRADR